MTIIIIHYHHHAEGFLNESLLCCLLAGKPGLPAFQHAHIESESILLVTGTIYLIYLLDPDR